MRLKNKALLIIAGLSFTLTTQADISVDLLEKADSTELNQNEGVGEFTAEGKTHKTKFVRVLFAAEGSEKEGESNAITPLVYDGVDPSGKTVKVRRFQITTKNTGYDEVQKSQEEDYKLKSVKEGVKLHIEIPVTADGTLQLEKAYVGNLAYNFGTRETRHNLTPQTISDIELKITKLDLPTFGTDNKPGDKGLIYNDGAIALTLKSKAKHIASDEISDFTVKIDGPISVTHIRGKEREKNAVSISPEIVALNK